MDSKLHMPTLGAAAPVRLAQVARSVRDRVEQGCLALWRGLETHGRTRSIRQLQILNARWESLDSDRARAVRGALDALIARQARRR